MPRKAEFILVGNPTQLIKALRESDAAFAKTGRAATEASNKVKAANDKTAANTKQAAREVETANRKAAASEAKRARDTEAAHKRILTSLRHLTVIGFAGAGFGVMSLIKAGADYEKQMARVKAVTDAQGPAFKSLGDLAKQLGKDTKFSAGQAAEAMYELGSAGFRAQDMAKVLPGTLSLAAASSVSLADAAEISANTLRGFGLRASEMGHVADVMAQAVASSSLELKDLQLSMSYVAAPAKDTGQSLEQVAAALSVMADAGIKGEKGGTALRAGLLRLVKPTKQVEAGLGGLHLNIKELQGPKGFKPLSEMVKLLTKHSEGLTRAQRNTAITQIFGIEAFSGMSKVLGAGAPKLERLTKAFEHSDGASKRMADTMNNTVAGAFENFTGSVETAGITIFEKFQVPLRKGLLGAAKLLNDFPTMVKSKFDMAGLLPAPTSRTNVIAAMLGDAVANVPWGDIGTTIAKGISKGVQLSGDFAKAVETGIGAALSHVDGRKLLSGLLRVVSQAIDALFSPSFWKDNFANIFATVTIAIPVAKILRIPGAEFLFNHISKPFFAAIRKLGGKLLGLFGNVGGTAIKALVSELGQAPGVGGAIVRIGSRIAKSLGNVPAVFQRNARLAVSWFVAELVGGAGKMGSAVGRLLGKALNKLASLVPDFVKAGAKLASQLISGLIRGLTSLPGKIGGAVKKGVGAIGSLIGIGDGIGKAIAPKGGGGGSAALKGAQGALGPFAAIGARFGLSVSSGRRPGSITSSGNVSYHSTGEAIDEAGSPSGRMRYFNYMKEHYGSRLAELIYTPGGMGIKNGQPYKYTGQVAADHYDHVHVALDTGKPGVGDGLGKFVSTSYGPPWGGIQGGGVTAAGVNLKNNPHTYGIAADPSVLKLGTSVKVWPNPFGYRGNFKVFDTGGAIKGHRIDFYDWRGRGAQLGWGRKTVQVSTAGAGGAGGSSRDAADAHLQRNLDRLDTLRNKLADVPADRHHVKQRHDIQAQIRSLVSANRGLRGDIRDAPSATDLREAAEKQGSRIVNAIAAPFMRGKTGIGALGRTVAGIESTIGQKDTEYGQAERRFGQSEEDLGTAGGRAKRTSELKALAQLKAAQLQRQQQELAALKSEIKKYDGLIKGLRGRLRGLRGATAARVRKRLKDYEDRRIELAARAQSLGAEIEDTKLDIGDIFKEGAEVAATADTAVEAGPTVSDRAGDLTSLIDLRERAGLIDSATAQQQRIGVLTAAIQGKFGATTEREQLQLQGDLLEAQQAGVAAVDDNTSAIRDLQKSIEDNTAFARSVMATENTSLLTSISDLISGQIAGVGIAGRALTPSGGFRARY